MSRSGLEPILAGVAGVLIVFVVRVVTQYPSSPVSFDHFVAVFLMLSGLFLLVSGVYFATTLTWR